MKKPTKKQTEYTHRLIKGEWEKAFGEPWPKGMTLQEMWRGHLSVLQEIEAQKALHAVIAKARALPPAEIKKGDNDPDWSFFWSIGWDANRNLHNDWIKQRLQKAIEQNDVNFFIRFGKELKRKPRRQELDKVGIILATRWTAGVGAVPPLSCFTDDALLEMLKILTGNEHLQFSQIRKARQRLGLETKEIQIKNVERVKNKEGGFRLIWVDRAEK